MSENKRVSDLYHCNDEFIGILERAEIHADTEKQVEFVQTFLEAFNSLGDFMMISEQDHDNLVRLAEGNTDEFFVTSH